MSYINVLGRPITIPGESKKQEKSVRHNYLSILVTVALVSTACSHGYDKHTSLTSAAVGEGGSGRAAEYRQLLDVDPADASARLHYATALSWEGNYRAADQQFATLLAQQPGNLEAMAGLGYNYVWSHRFELAEQQFKAALDNAPDNYGLRKGLALTYLQSGRPSQALEALKSLKEQHPDDLEILAAIESAEVGMMANMNNRYHE